MTRLSAFLLIALLVPAMAMAQDINMTTNVDLILPPVLESPDAPFYRGASVKLGETVMPVVEEKLPNGVLAQYNPQRRVVVVSDNADISENRKSQALMDVVSALGMSDIATAAGSED